MGKSAKYIKWPLRSKALAVKVWKQNTEEGWKAYEVLDHVYWDLKRQRRGAVLRREASQLPEELPKSYKKNPHAVLRYFLSDVQKMFDKNREKLQAVADEVGLSLFKDSIGTLADWLREKSPKKSA